MINFIPKYVCIIWISITNIKESSPGLKFSSCMLYQQLKFLTAYDTCAVIQMAGKFKQNFSDIDLWIQRLFIFPKEGGGGYWKGGGGGGLVRRNKVYRLIKKAMINWVNTQKANVNYCIFVVFFVMLVGWSLVSSLRHSASQHYHWVTQG